MVDMEKIIYETAYELLKRAATTLPPDVKKAIFRAYENETTNVGKAQLKSIIDNIEMAEKYGMNICSDTGLPLFFISWGLKSNFKVDVRKPLALATKKATRDIPMRPNVIHPLTKKNTGTNVGWNMPYIYYDLNPSSEYLEITAVHNGFGSESKSSLVWITTSESIPEAIIRCTVDNTVAALGEPCPPNIVGLGIGGTADIAMHLAKRAQLRSPVGSPNQDVEVAKLERRIMDALNRTGIGPMAMGGNVTCLAVHAEFCGAQTAVVPLAITYQCWAARRSTARIFSDGKVVYVTHPNTK